MLLMVQKPTCSGICHVIHWNVKADNKCMKDYEKSKASIYLRYWDANNVMDEQWHKSFLYAVLSGLKIYLNLVKILQTSINKIVVKDIFEGDV